MGSLEGSQSIGFHWKIWISNGSNGLCSGVLHYKTNATKSNTQMETKHKRWIPPDSGRFMLNVDASYTKMGGWYGFILRDHKGVVWKLGAGRLQLIQSAEHGELMVIWKSFVKMKEFWDQPIVIATDCKSLVSQIDQRDPNLTVLRGFCWKFSIGITKG